MIPCNHYNLWLKCYITFCYIVADEKRGSPYLARAIANLKLILEKNIKIVVYSIFSILISVLPLLYSTIQLIESPILTLRNFITSFGIVVLPDKLFGRATEIFVSYSNTVITPIFIDYIIYVYTQHIYNICHKIGRNIYILCSVINN